MAAKRDYYEVLGVSRNADAGTIKKAYRKLAKKYHPDTNPGDKQAEKSFKEVTEAYTILSDPEKKRLYDQFGHSAFDGSGAGQNPHGNPFENAGGGYQEYHLRAEIWTIFLEICLIIFFTADSPAVSKTVDLKAEDLAKMDFTGRGLTAVSL